MQTYNLSISCIHILGVWGVWGGGHSCPFSANVKYAAYSVCIFRTQKWIKVAGP